MQPFCTIPEHGSICKSDAGGDGLYISIIQDANKRLFFYFHIYLGAQRIKWTHAVQIFFSLGLTLQFDPLISAPYSSMVDISCRQH